ncbi:hypothetical protein EHS86_18060 [Erwinia amylovora]|nr:hypothetical protein EHS86_18060 [Erwinia amylovora]
MDKAFSALLFSFLFPLLSSSVFLFPPSLLSSFLFILLFFFSPLYFVFFSYSFFPSFLSLLASFSASSFSPFPALTPYAFSSSQPPPLSFFPVLYPSSGLQRPRFLR